VRCDFKLGVDEVAATIIFNKESTDIRSSILYISAQCVCNMESNSYPTIRDYRSCVA
jgi:hypothetical protein